jgi:RNA polymerase sigma factor (sigma-70 family)
MDKSQLGKILEDLHREAYLWSRQCCQYDDELAKDVLQVVYLKIFENRARYLERSSFRTWLFSVIRNTAIDSLKERPVYHDLEDAMTVLADEQKEEEMDYKEMMRKLSEKQAQVLLLAFYHNMTLNEISVVMEIGIGTVRTHYDRGKERLKELIEKTKLENYVGR